MKTRKPIYMVNSCSRITRKFPLFSLWQTTTIITSIRNSALLSLFFFPVSLNANDNDSTFSPSEFWPIVEQQLNQEDIDSSVQIALLLTRGYCQEDYDCLKNNCEKLRDNLESLFNLPAAIRVTNELARAAEQENDLPTLADSYLDLNRFHDALGHRREGLIYADKAQQAYEKIGNQSAVTRIKIMKEEASLNYRDIREVLPKLEKLLVEVTSMNDSVNKNRLNLRLIHYTRCAGEYQLMEKHVVNAEKNMVSSPSNPKEYYYAIHTTLGRGDLTMINEDFDNAEEYYQKALRLSNEMPDRWLEIKTLYSLTELEWKRGNRKKAKDYLNIAIEKGTVLNLDDHLIYGYDLAAKIAEEEGLFAEALAFTKRKLLHEEKLSNKSKGFDPKSFFLEKEKEKLVAEQIKHRSQLHLKESQLRNSLIIIALGLMLMTALGYGYQNQLKSKTRLAYQNSLIKNQAERLAQLDTAKTRFFANVSHELRTPLTLLLGPIKSLIKEKKLSKQQVQLLHLANDSGQQMERLVREILDLGKLEMGKMTLDEQQTKLWPFFHPYLLQFESLAQQKNINYAVSLGLKENWLANIDQEKCRQVLYNLLSNAFKYTPNGGKVEVEIFIENNQFHLTVMDNGQGIHANDLPYLFDRYFQTDHPEKPAVGGSGIGLAICYEYAHLFGGKITVESELGQGSTFHFQFPVQLTTANNKTVVAPPAEVSSPLFQPPVPEKIETESRNAIEVEKPTILVVEDNPKVQHYIRILLSEQYQVLAAENGKSALEKLNKERNCQLIISDLMMPIMDGYQFLEHLKSNDNTRHIPVIMLTARAEPKDRLKALRLGVDDYLLKPFAEEELLVRIKNLLENHAVRQQVFQEPQKGNEYKTVETTNHYSSPNEECKNKEKAPIPKPVALSSSDHEWLALLEENLQKELTKFNFKLEHLAELMLVSRRQLGRQVKALTGLTPSEYLLEARLQKARLLLDEKQVKTVKEAAYTVGLRDAKHFSRQFRRRFGKSPSDILIG